MQKERQKDFVVGIDFDCTLSQKHLWGSYTGRFFSWAMKQHVGMEAV